jgi:hypothetical protein
MSHPWHRANPALFEKEKSEVEAAYPSLRFRVVGDVVLVCGTFPIVFEGRQLDGYVIEIELGKDHPKSMPIVRETGGRIPRTADRHMSGADGTACVILPDERWRVWPYGSSLLQFVEGPVRNFFLGQSMVELGDPWPFGQWAHGAEGIRGYYAELLGSDDVDVITGYLDYLSKKKIKGHWACPCRSGKRLRDCHWALVEGLKTKIPRRVAAESRGRLREKFTR